ncbi:MAG: glyoxalase [Actinomycetota bacterium]
MAPTDPPVLAELLVGDSPEQWRKAGFTVDGDRCRLGGIDVVLTGPDRGRGIHGWGWRATPSAPMIGDLPGHVATAGEGRATTPVPHPNTALGVFYVVLFGPSWHEAADSLSAAGIEPGDARPMSDDEGAMLRSLAPVGEAAIEVIGPPGHDPERGWRLWGAIVEVGDIETTAAVLGPGLRAVKPAVQRGRRIATLDRSVGSSVALAFMSRVGE